MSQTNMPCLTSACGVVCCAPLSQFDPGACARRELSGPGVRLMQQVGALVQRRRSHCSAGGATAPIAVQQPGGSVLVYSGFSRHLLQVRARAVLAPCCVHAASMLRALPVTR